MLTLAVALVVLGTFGFLLWIVRRIWPAAWPWWRILLVELVVAAAWLLGGNAIATWREKQAEHAWKALDPKAVVAPWARGGSLSPTGVELAKLASGLGLTLAGVHEPNAAKPDAASQAALAKVGSFVNGVLRQEDDTLGPAPAELSAWLILHDETVRAIETQLLEGGPIDWGAPEGDDSLSYSPHDLLRLHSVLVASALERMRAGDPAGASSGLAAAAALTASLRDRPDTVSRMQALAQDRRLLGGLRFLDPVPADWERRLDEIEEHTRPLGDLARETLALIAETQNSYTTLRGLILELDPGPPLREGPRPWISRAWLALSGGPVPLESLWEEAAAERRRTRTPFHRYVQGPLERPYMRLVVADHAMVEAKIVSAVLAEDPCTPRPAEPAARPASWSPLVQSADPFVPRLARSTAVFRVELELTRLVQRARFLRAASPRHEWPAELAGTDSRACAGRRFVARVDEEGSEEIRLESSPFADDEATVAFRMAGR
jgi:hypothetical protein